MPRTQQPISDLYVSHTTNGTGGIRWFIVDGSEQPMVLKRGTVEDQVKQLLDDGRTVYHIMAKPRLTRRLLDPQPIRLKPTGIAPSRRRGDGGGQKTKKPRAVS